MTQLKWAGIALLGIVILTTYSCKSGGTEVEADFVKRRTLVQKVSESGTIQPHVEVSIAPDVSGEVTGIFVAEGDYVKQGQLLFTIKPDNYIAARDQADASLQSARANYENSVKALVQSQSTYTQDSINYEINKKLFDQKVISQTDWNTARTKPLVSKSQVEAQKEAIKSAYYNIKNAEANLRQSSETLRKTSVFAPMDGTCTSMTAKLGQRVLGTQQFAGTEVLKIADLTNIEVQVNINENDIVSLSLGDSASIEADAYPDKKFKGEVIAVGYSATVATSGATNTADQVTNYPVKVHILPSSYLNDKVVMKGHTALRGPFRPGMSGMVNIYTAQADSAISVPIQAVTIDKSKGNQLVAQEIVYKIKHKDLVRAVPVKTGISDEQFIEIKSGLKVGDEIVSGSYQVINKILTDSMQVQIKKTDFKKKGGKDNGPRKPPPPQ